MATTTAAVKTVRKDSIKKITLNNTIPSKEKKPVAAVSKVTKTVGLYFCDKCPFKCKRAQTLANHKYIHMPPLLMSHYTCQVCNKVFRKYDRFVLHKQTHGTSSTTDDWECLLKPYNIAQKKIESASKDKSLQDNIFVEKCQNKMMKMSDDDYLLSEDKCENKTSPDHSSDEEQDSLPELDENVSEVGLEISQQINIVEIEIDPQDIRNGTSDNECEHPATQRQKKVIREMNVKEKNQKTPQNNPSSTSSNKTSMKTKTRGKRLPKSKPEVKKMFQCDECGYIAKQKGTLTAHQKKHSNIQQLLCPHCPFKTCWTNSLRLHLRIHSHERPFQCKECEYECSQSYNLKRHMKIHSKTKTEEILRKTKVKLETKTALACVACNLEFTAENDYADHIKQVHTIPLISNESDRPFIKCDRCDFKTHSQDILVLHTIKHEKKKHQCNSCSYSTASIFLLKRHSSKHSDIYPYSCDHCLFRSKRLETMELHKTKHNDPLMPHLKNYTCDICGKKFRKYLRLQNHRLTHFKEKHTNSSDDLQNLPKPHKIQTDKSFSCDQCEYKTARRYDLVIHTRKHTGEKPFACEFCKYRASLSSHLTTHRRIHTGEKPYVCNICGYSCAASGLLQKHMKTHKNDST